MNVLLVRIAVCCAFLGGHNVYQEALHADGRLESDLKRDETSHPAAVLDFFGIEKGMHVADILAGGGYYSELVSHIVGDEGRVLCQNNKAYLSFVQKELDKRFTEGRLSNVDYVVRETDDMQLGESQFDAVLLILGFHDIYYFKEGDWKIDKQGFLGQIKRALKPGGKLCIVDHVGKPGSGSQQAQELHRIEPAFVRSELQDMGFEFVAKSDVLRNPDDNHEIIVFDDSIRRHTDRFVYLFRKSDH